MFPALRHFKSLLLLYFVLNIDEFVVSISLYKALLPSLFFVSRKNLTQGIVDGKISSCLLGHRFLYLYTMVWIWNAAGVFKVGWGSPIIFKITFWNLNKATSVGFLTHRWKEENANSIFNLFSGGRGKNRSIKSTFYPRRPRPPHKFLANEKPSAVTVHTRAS